MYQPVIEYSYLTEIKFVNAVGVGTKVNFLDIPQFRTAGKSQKELVKTIGIQCFTAAQLAISPNSNTVIAAADVTGLVLTLAIGSGEDVFMLPCFDLVSGNNSGLIRLLKEKQINFPKSYVTILNVGTIAVNQAVLFNIIYRNK